MFQLRGIESSDDRWITNCKGLTESRPCPNTFIIPVTERKDSEVPRTTPVRIACVPSEIRKKHFPSTTQKQYRLSQTGRQMSYICTVDTKYQARINSSDFKSLKSCTIKHANSTFTILFCLMTQFQLQWLYSVRRGMRIMETVVKITFLQVWNLRSSWKWRLRLWSSGFWRRVDSYVFTDVLEEYITHIFRIEEQF
jgi:hypothetical protein